MLKFQIIDLTNSTPLDWVLPASNGPITVPNAHLLFSGTFQRQGPDLLIQGDGHRALLPDYFNHEHPPALLSPEGAMLDAATVRALSGVGSQWQFAQAGGGALPAEIGTVRTLVGTATAVRGGAAQQLEIGQPVFQGDVIETGANSTLGITLVDRTVFSLSSSARMVMNELVYDPSRNDNSMAVSLVQGTFVFITGQVAKTGSIAVTTPVATMGIRGTTPIVKLSATDGSGEFTIGADPGGVVGTYVLNSVITGQEIAAVSSPDVVVRIQSSSGPFDIALKTQGDQNQDLQLLGPAYQVFQLLGQRGEAPGDIHRTGKGQGGVEFAYNPQPFADLHLTALLVDTHIGADDRFAGLDDRGLFDILRQVDNPAAIVLDLDVAAPGTNRTAQFAENGIALPVSTAAQIIVPAGVSRLSGATIVLQNALDGDNMIVGQLPAGITVTITRGSIHVNLTGEASVADYIAAIQAISFVNTSDNPSLDVRVIEVTITAINGETATATTLITIQSINDAPVNHLPAAQTSAEDQALVFSSANGNAIAVSDPDAGSQPISVTLTVQHGTLALAAAAAVTITGNGSAMIALTGSQTAINAALDGLTYTPSRDFNGPDSIVVSTSDNGASGDGGALTTTSAGLGITMSAVNDAPVHSLPAAQSIDEDQPLTFSAANGNAIKVSDADAGLGVIEVHLSVAHGTLLVHSNTGVSIDGNGTTGVTLTGSQSAINAVLDGLVYKPIDDYDRSDTLTVTTNDFGLTGAGGPGVTTDTVTINVNPVNDAPTLDAVRPVTFHDTERSDSFYPATGMLSGHDIDQAAGVALTYGLANGVIGASAFGTLVVQPDGHYTFTPNATAIDALPDDANASVNYLVAVTDDHGATATTTLTFNFTGENDPAHLSAVSRQLTEGNTAQQISTGGVLTISDIDSPATFLPLSNVAGVFGHFAIDSAGAWTYIANSPHDEFVGGRTYTDSFTVAAADGTTTSVTVNILGTNDAPTTELVMLKPISDDGYRIITQADLLSNAHDVDSTVLVAINLQIASGGGTLIDLQNGTWRYEPANHDRHDDDHDYDDHDTATVQLTYTISDDAAPAAGTVVGFASIIVTDDDHWSSSNLDSVAPLGAVAAQEQIFTGVGSAVDTIDLSSTNFANVTQIGFGAVTQSLANYMVDIIDNFDKATHQLDVSELLNSLSQTITPSNIDSFVQANVGSDGSVAIFADPDGAGPASHVQIASMSAPATSPMMEGDQLSIIFDNHTQHATISAHVAG